MPTSSIQPELTTTVRGVLDAVRRRIRAYVWIEGLALLIAVLGLAFWLGMAGDWMFEPSPAARRIGLIAVGCAALYVVYRYLLRRIFVPISDATAAVLLERRFPESARPSHHGGRCGRGARPGRHVSPATRRGNHAGRRRGRRRRSCHATIQSRAAAPRRRHGCRSRRFDRGFCDRLARYVRLLAPANRAQRRVLAAAGATGSRRLSAGCRRPAHAQARPRR